MLSVAPLQSHTRLTSWRHAATFRIADFEKIDEIHFRLGIIYKQLQRYTESLQVRQYISLYPLPPGTPRVVGRPTVFFSVLVSTSRSSPCSFPRNAVLRSDLAQSAPPPKPNGHLVPDWPRL